jgi:hypothetical protein
MKIVGSMRVAFGTCVALALACSMAAGLAAAGSASEAAVVVTRLDVRVEGGELTLDVRDAPLVEVLRDIGARAGLEITMRGDLDVAVTQSFARLPLEAGIKRLADGRSVTAAYAPAPDGSSREVLTRVWVVGASTTRRAAATGTSSAPTPRAPAPDEALGAADSGSAPAVRVVAEGIADIQTLVGEAAGGSEAAARRLVDLSTSELDAQFREQAVAALARLKGPMVEPALTAALDDDEAAVRMRAVRGLRGTGTETAVALLARASTDDADPEVRLAALSALMSFPGRAMVQGLVRAAADPDSRVRDAAFRGLTWWNARRPGAP